MPAADGSIFSEVGITILIVHAHKDRKTVVDNSRMPEQDNHKKCCKQLVLSAELIIHLDFDCLGGFSDRQFFLNECSDYLMTLESVSMNLRAFIRVVHQFQRLFS